MPKTYRCCVAGCNNDSRYTDKIIKRNHVEGDLKFHYFPKDESKRNEWVNQVSRGLIGFKCSDYKVACSNHFEYGKPTFNSSYPTLYLIASDIQKTSPKKRRKINKSLPSQSSSSDCVDIVHETACVIS